MKNFFTLVISLGLILFILMIATVGHTNLDLVETIPLTDDILRSKAAFAVVEEEIVRHLNLSLLSEWDYQKLRGPVLWKIRTPIHSYLRKAFGRIVDTVDFGASVGSGSPSQTPPMNWGERPILHKRAAEIIRDFIDQEHISTIIRSDVPIGIGEVAAIRRLRGEVRYTYELINGACVVIPIKNLAALIRQPFITEMWPDSKGNLLSNGLGAIGAIKVHSAHPSGLGVTGKGVRVAVVDGGIDSNHPEFKGRLIDTRGVAFSGGFDFFKDDIDHGTHVAGIIGAVLDGNIFTGVAPEVELLDAQVDLNENTKRFTLLGQNSYGDAMDAIKWAAHKKSLHSNKKADIINMSLGWPIWEYGRNGDDPMSEMIDEVVRDGVVFIVAAGNEARERVTGEITTHSSPKLHPFTITSSRKTGRAKIIITLIWDTEKNDLDLAIRASNFASRTNPAQDGRTYLKKAIHGTSKFYEQLELTFNQADLSNGAVLQLQVEASNVQDSQKYEVWVSAIGDSISRFDTPDSRETVGVPAYSRKSITVGAIDHTKSVVSFSSHGPSKTKLIKPETVAPGFEIYSAVAAPDYYGGKSGTSMAAPHVAGVAALILDAVGKNDQDEWNFGPDEVKSAIVYGAEGLTNVPDNTYGAGLVKADNIIFGDTVPANGRLRFEIKPRLYRSNYGGYRLSADPYLVAAISWEAPRHDLDLVLSDASNGRRLPMVSQTSLTSAKIGGNEFILPDRGTIYFLDVINRAQEPVAFTGAATHKIEVSSTQNQPPMVANTIPNQTLTAGDAAAPLNLSTYFRDPEGKSLTYTVAYGDQNIALAQVIGSQLTFRTVNVGDTTVTVTATNPDGLSVSQTFTLTVPAGVVQQKPEAVGTIPTQNLTVKGPSRPVDVAPYFSSQNDLTYEVSSNPSGIVTERISGSQVTIEPLQTGSASVIVTAFDRNDRRLYAIQTIPVVVRSDHATIVRPPSTQTFILPTTTNPSLEGFREGVSVITQLTQGFTLAVRPSPGTNNIPRERIGSGITGIITDGPRSKEDFRWWYIEWDIRGFDLEGWSVESDRGQILFRRPPDLEIRGLEVSEGEVAPGETFEVAVRVRNNGPGESAPIKVYVYYSLNRHSDLVALNKDSSNLRVAGSGKINVPSLQEGMNREVSLRVKAPMTPNRYYYGALLPSNIHDTDYTDNLDPDVLHNNFATEARVEVTSSPDLIVESISANKSTVDPGEAFRLEVTVRNQGIGEPKSNAKLRYYRSSTVSISDSDTEVGDDSVTRGNLDTNGTDEESISLTAPSEPGIYYYGACVARIENESNSSNNCSGSVAITVRGTAPQPTPDLPDLTVQQPTRTVMSMYWTDWETNKIQRANLNRISVQDLVTTGLVSPYGIALDDAGGKMYWTDAGTASIHRANLDGSNVQNLIPLGLGIPICIALDVTGGKMYWTDRGTGKIQRANLDGANVEDLVSGVKGLHGIALNVAGGKMYWTDNEAGKIQRANLNGTGIENLITTGLQLPNEIVLDVAGGKMYWTDDGTGKIQRANLNGTNVEDLVTAGLYVPVGITLDLAGGKMYWTDLGRRKIQRANLNGANVEDLVTTGLTAPFGIALSASLTVSPPVVVREDVNNDGVVDVQDVTLVDQNNLDLNGDGVSDIADILLVVEAIVNAGAAPTLYTQALRLLTAEKVQQWLVEAMLLGEDSPTSRNGILMFEQLLVLLTPKKTTLLPNYPNPFNPETWIPYQIAEPTNVAVHIYAVDGHLVRTLMLGYKQAGIYHNQNRAAYWDGRNELGEPVASGIYFYTLSTRNFTATRKMLIRK